jgi:hypothetical protein
VGSYTEAALQGGEHGVAVCSWNREFLTSEERAAQRSAQARANNLCSPKK